MMTAKVGRGGFHVVLQMEGGHSSIGLSGAGKSSVSRIPCSLVGLFNVLSGVDYVAVAGERQCLVRMHGSHIEFQWKRGTVETVIRLSKGEYKGLLKCGNETSDKRAA